MRRGRLYEAENLVKCLMRIHSLVVNSWGEQVFKNHLTKCDDFGTTTTRLITALFVDLSRYSQIPKYNFMAKDLITWIIQFQIPLTRICLDFTVFESLYIFMEHISKQQFKEIIGLGYNPKVETYRGTSATKGVEMPENHTYDTMMTAKYQKLYTKFDDNLWFNLIDSACSKNCDQDREMCIPKQGFRITKIDKIGKGGYGTVFKGHLHNEPVAAKYIDITKKYKTFFKGGFIHDLIAHLTDDITFEAVIQGKLKHDHILSVIEYWIQCEKQTTIQLVIATPLCLMNLQEWLDTKMFNFAEIRDYMVQMCEGQDY